VPCNPGNVENMKILVENCFPITYKDGFYEKVATDYNDFTRFVTVSDVIVGGISARIEQDAESNTYLHVLILLVLQKYRRFHLASQMLSWLVAEARKSSEKIKYLSLHVQKCNQAAVNFYLSQGFQVAEEIPACSARPSASAIRCGKAW